MKPTILSLAIIALAHAAALAGPLSPPAGPIAPTHKTLSELEPRTPINAATTPGDATSIFRITQPGSYYLTGNLTGQSGKNGIEIAASNVSIDLMGFTLRGVPGSLSGLATDGTAGSLTAITVRGGLVREWAGSGVSLSPATVCTVQDVTAIGNLLRGVFVGASARIERCTARDNGANGIETGANSMIAGCLAAINDGTGISASSGSTIRDSRADSNGIGGFLQFGSSTLDSCTAQNNSARGGAIGSNSLVVNSHFVGNGAEGITAGSASTVRACVVAGSSLHGITAGEHSLVESNLCKDNGTSGAGAGIRITGARARVHDNTVVNSPLGIVVDAAGGVITNNTAIGNTTNYQTAAGNLVGQILGGSGTITTNNPWINWGL